MRTIPLAICLVAVFSILASAQDEKMTINKLSLASRSVPAEVKTVGGYHGPATSVLTTPWVVLGVADCNQRCVEVKGTPGGGVGVTVWDAQKGFTKVRLGADVPSSCGVAGVFGEIRDERDSAINFAFHDPTEHPRPHSRVHILRYEAGVASIVFQNEHAEKAREARLNVICK